MVKKVKIMVGYDGLVVGFDEKINLKNIGKFCHIEVAVFFLL